MNSPTPQHDDQRVQGINEVELAAGLAPTPGYRYASVVADELFVAGQVPSTATATSSVEAIPPLRQRHASTTSGH